jgi:hypothetical protein
MEMIWIPIIGTLATAATVVLVVFFVTRSRQRRLEAQVQMQSRMIDKFGTAPELISFLQSGAGRQFVAGVQTAPAVLTRERILGGFSRSIVLTALGVAFVFLAFFENDRDFGVPAALLFFLGVGYFVATMVTYKLSGKMHLGEIEQPSLSSSTDVVRP